MTSRSPRAAPRRRLTRLTTVGLAAHVFFELAAGVGMPLASVLRPLPAAAVWATGTAGSLRAAGNRPPSRTADGVFAVLNGLALAAVLGHLTSWPRRRTRLGLPWLEDCEGLGAQLMPAYNTILYGSGAAALAATVTENRHAPRWLPLAVTALAPVFAQVQHAEFRRLRRQARTRPTWFTRRLLDARA